MKASQLRNAVLQLAIQGKLVLQDPTDEPASVLLDRIRAEKKQLIKERKIKPEKPLTPITDVEKPFEIPNSWEWVRLGEIISIVSGLTYNKRNLDIKTKNMIRILRGGNINELCYSFRYDDVFIDESFVKKELLLRKNDLITPAVTSIEHIGKMALIEKDYDNTTAGGFVLILKQHYSNDVFAKFLLYSLSSKFHRNNCRNITNKSGQAFYNLSREKLMELYVPLPPLSEQKRIVDRIEEIMPLIDEYEKLEQEFSALEDAFPNKLKKSILQYAIQGKLVPQDLTDEPASVLIKKIKAEKELLIKEKKIKLEKPLPPITDEEKPFDIPESWVWVRLGEIFEVGTGMTPLKSETKYYANGIIPWVTSSLTSSEYINSSDSYITEYALNHTTLKLYSKGTLIMAMYGQGKTRGQISELNIEATINQACSALESIYKNDVLTRYIKLFFRYNYDNARKGAEGSAQPNLNLTKVKMTVIPLPPLEEQQNIIAKVENIMALCNLLSEKSMSARSEIVGI